MLTGGGWASRKVILLFVLPLYVLFLFLVESLVMEVARVLLAGMSPSDGSGGVISSGLEDVRGLETDSIDLAEVGLEVSVFAM